MSPRVYTRTFDWDEARRLHGDGLPYKEIAARLGVSWAAIQFACDDTRYKLALQRSAAWGAGGTCRDCGSKATRKSLNHESRCRPCASKAKATTARENELQCNTCREWKPDDEFPHSKAEKYGRRGRHAQCRVCCTVAKREYRRRNLEKSRAYDREYKRRRKAEQNA